MKRLLTVLLIFGAISALAQVAPNKYYIEFTDKNNNTYSLDRPEEFLSERSLQRRANQDIDLDISDLPVSQVYVDSLESLGLDVLNVSKWFNSATVFTTDAALMDTIGYLGFISNSSKYEPISGDKVKVPSKYKVLRDPQKGASEENYYNYGTSSDQVFMHNGQMLHNQGYRGQGMMIAVTDAGYIGLPNLPCFDSLYEDNRVLASRNFVHGGTFVNSYSTHGMRVLSIMAGNAPGNLIGTAPEAQYLLLMSEDAESENIIEEINWLSAAEFADSMGADIINVSLGYLDFDMSEYNHTYAQMNGASAIISYAASVASSKGMLVVVAAANSGEDEVHPWINAPGDAKDVITAGAIWSSQTYAAFSSIGPSYDGRVKPDLVAMGAGTTNQETDGNYSQGNGTSFAAPLLTGMFACLWQQFPEKTNFEIMEAAKQSATLYGEPSIYLGYGIPDFYLASQILSVGIESVKVLKPEVFPNPYTDSFSVSLKNQPGDSIVLFVNDLSGRKNYMWMQHTALEQDLTIKINELANLKSGVYIVTVIINQVRYSEKLIKK